MADGRKTILTPEEAETLLPGGDIVHNYLNPSAGMFLGCDFSREETTKALRNAVRIEIGGDACKKMGHALVVWDTDQHYSFFAADKDRVAELETKRAA